LADTNGEGGYSGMPAAGIEEASCNIPKVLEFKSIAGLIKKKSVGGSPNWPKNRAQVSIRNSTPLP